MKSFMTFHHLIIGQLITSSLFRCFHKSGIQYLDHHWYNFSMLQLNMSSLQLVSRLNMSHIGLYYTYNCHLTIDKKKVFKQKIIKILKQYKHLENIYKKDWTKAIYDDNDGMTFWEIFDCCFKCHWRNHGPDIEINFTFYYHTGDSARYWLLKPSRLSLTLPSHKSCFVVKFQFLSFCLFCRSKCVTQF